jgi:hypothetical protein
VPGATPATGGNPCYSERRGAGPAMDGSPTMFARALELRSPEATASSPATRSGSGSGIFVRGFPSTHSPTIIGNVCSGGSSGFDAVQGDGDQ